jgi:protein-disulfide isomerase
MAVVRGQGGKFVRATGEETQYPMMWPAPERKSWVEKVAPVLMVVVVAMSFALGSMWSKIQYLEANGGTANPSAGANAAGGGGEPVGKYAKFADALNDLGKQAGLNVGELTKCVDSGEKAGVVADDFKQGGEVGVTGTPGFFINGKFLGGAFPVASFKEIIDRELNGTGSTDYKTYKEANLAAAGASGGFKAEPVKFEVGQAAIDGASTAKVTIVEFSDFQCPYCQRGFETMQQLKKDYEGKIKIVYKNFPLSQIHPHAQKAAEAFECARTQGAEKAWKLHDLLFQTQRDWSSSV